MTCDGCGKNFEWEDDLTQVGHHFFCDVCLEPLSAWLDQLSLEELISIVEAYHIVEGSNASTS